MCGRGSFDATTVVRAYVRRRIRLASGISLLSAPEWLKTELFSRTALKKAYCMLMKVLP